MMHGPWIEWGIVVAMVVNVYASWLNLQAYMKWHKRSLEQLAQDLARVKVPEDAREREQACG